MAVRRVKKEDLKRIARATGGKNPSCVCVCVCVNAYFLPLPATVCISLANLEGEETFDASLLGQAECVVSERVCDDELILVKG